MTTATGGTPALQVLVVEDDDGQAVLTLRSLEKQGFQVVREGTGGGCLNRLAAGGDYVVLLDLGLPDVSGLTVLEKIVARSSETPVIVVTGVDDITIAVQALRNGAWDYIVKRVDLSHLQELPHIIARNLDRQRLVRERNLFLSMLSHDIKNPIQVILSYADIVQEDPQLPAESHQFLQRIKDNAENILRLVSDFVEARKIEAGKLVLHREPLSVPSVLAELVAQQTGLAASKTIALRLDVADDLPTMWADRHYLQRALVNLISNAIKYTGTGGSVTVHAHGADGRLLIAVSDTGPGIPADELAYVFDRYRRVRGTAGEGSGLGLFIVKAIAEAHEGEITVTSTVGVGSTFTLRLPLPAAAPAQVPATG